ncbi:MAG: flagellar basal body rod protein FlgB [Planctomycetales bacterium]|nr:flagellar basal body rod protein FlgB [Planctomycetales bacterium]
MLNGILAGSPIGVLEQVAAFAEARHGLLAGNIANLDTPGYKTRDLSVDNFQSRLKDAIESQAQASATQYVSPGVRRLQPDEAMQEVKATMKSILYHDQSDVGLEQQVTELANNQFMHNMAIALLSQQFRQLQTAVSERV